MDAFTFIDTRDIADVAAKVLSEDKHASKIYTLTSPYASTYEDIARYLSEILGETITYAPVSQEDFEQSLLDQGSPDWRAFDLAYIADAYSSEDKHLMSNDLKEILGRPARSIKTFLEDCRSSFEK